MTDNSMDLVIFGIVVGLRVIVPLFIPRFPLPAIIAAMIIDAADQTIFQNNTELDLTNYQSYDKALDIYYLAIAYLSTMRNWTGHVAFNTSRFLWYYRLVGVVLFELTHVRSVLLIFPNTFEYFFDFYEGVKTRWNPLRMSKRTILAAAAFIWIFIKLPQEYWIHVAQLDTTDLIKEDLFGVPVDTPISEIIKDNLLFFVGLGLILAALVVGLRYVFRYKLPPKDWKFSVDADSRGSGCYPGSNRAAGSLHARPHLHYRARRKDRADLHGDHHLHPDHSWHRLRTMGTSSHGRGLPDPQHGHQ